MLFIDGVFHALADKLVAPHLTLGFAARRGIFLAVSRRITSSFFLRLLLLVALLLAGGAAFGLQVENHSGKMAGRKNTYFLYPTSFCQPVKADSELKAVAVGTGAEVIEAGVVALSGSGVQATLTGAKNYAWDAMGRLAGVAMPDGQEHGYRYDYRTGLQQAAHGGQPAKATAVVFSGGLSVAEYESETEVTTIPSPSQSTVSYVRGPDMGGGVGGLLYSLRREGGATVPVARFNLSNGRGDIVAQSDQSATLTWTASYEAGGKRTKETGSNADKQRANSKDEDPTGLLNEGFRYRELETMVWLSRDPAGFVDGPNLYAYVKQNPWTAFDPHGLQGRRQYSKPMLEQRKRAAEEGPQVYSTIADAVPMVGTIKGLYEIGTGHDPLTKSELSKGERAVAALATVAGVVPFGKTIVRKGLKAVVKRGGDEAVETAVKQSDNIGGSSAKVTSEQASAQVEQAAKETLHGPFHRLGDTAETLEAVQSSGQLWGKPPRNVFASDIPKAKAYDGPLPEGATGFEFKTPVAPDGGTPPGRVNWSGPRPGVTVDDDWAKIPVEVTKQTIKKSGG